MGALQHSRIADEENIQHSVDLKWNQYPTIAPLTYRLGKAQIEQKTIVDDVILNMTRWETRNSTLGHVDMYRWRSWTWACNQIADERIETIHETCAERDKDGCYKPGDGRSTPAPDNHSYQG